ncbi:Phosphotransferase enzyme family protein [Enhydrobacter aerosaccus]|uniref:Phosphotransferase enzyme family protein n=1 Tax=Enhydrobacter aerosaccus TaxID=225324 RepID=A0A1T4QIF4_9HYPH|nr:phosphotransferase [Enhydrobacter aerosaccus]SKA03583.1 Phosphotransferase enzyme family protein [Enhydrobacter aerosaccus]
MLNSIPEDRRQMARAALKAAFGPTAVSLIKPIVGGASALIYRIEVGGRPYLLRFDSFLRDDVRDPPRAYRCMQAAAEAGIAPAIRYADAAAGVVVMDFIESRSLADYPGGLEALSRALGHLAARLQAIPPFPAVGDYPSIIGGMFDRLLRSRLFADGLLDAHREGFERIRAAYPWNDAALVSSHNDSHPGNILFDGQRLWLIDWETAYRNDPLVDIAIMTMYVAATPDLQEVLIRSWSGRPSDGLLRARLLVMRQLTRLFYALANGFFVATARPDLRESDLAAPTPAAFRAALDDGRLISNTFETQRIASRVALRAFLEGLATPAFADALAIVRSG